MRAAPEAPASVPTQAALERLQQLTEALSVAATLGDVTRAILDRAVPLLEASAVVVYWERRPGELEIVQGVGMSEEYASGYRRVFADEPLPCAEAYRTGEPVWLGSREAVAARFPTLVPFARRERFEGWAAIPLSLGGSRGAVGLHFATPRGFDDGERAFLAAAVRQCGHAVERARLFDAHKRLADRLQHLQVTAATLSAEAPPRDVAAVAFRALGSVGACAAEIHAFVPPDRLALVARHGRPADEPAATMPLDAPLPAAEVVRSGRALWLDAAEIAERYPSLEAGRAEREEGGWAIVPLLASGRAIGALSVAFRSGRALEADERTFVRLVAQPCAAALERAQLFAEAKRSRAEAESAAALLGAAWAAAPVPLALLDRDGGVVKVNEAFARIAGVPADAQAGRTPAQIFPGVAGVQLGALVAEALASGAPVARDVLGETRDAAGTTRRFAASAAPLRLEGAAAGVVLTVIER